MSRRQANTRFKLPGRHHTPPDTTRPQNHHCTVTAWRGTRTARHHALAESSLHRHCLARDTYRHAPRACRIITAPSPPGGLRPATRRHSSPPPGAPATRRQAPPCHRGLCCSIPPGGTLPTARRHTSIVAIATDFCSVRLATRSRHQAPYQ